MTITETCKQRKEETKMERKKIILTPGYKERSFWKQNSKKYYFPISIQSYHLCRLSVGFAVKTPITTSNETFWQSNKCLPPI